MFLPCEALVGGGENLSPLRQASWGGSPHLRVLRLRRGRGLPPAPRSAGCEGIQTKVALTSLSNRQRP